jgi:hypothetical protein
LKKGNALSWKCTMRLGILENSKPWHKYVKYFTSTIGQSKWRWWSRHAKNAKW